MRNFTSIIIFLIYSLGAMAQNVVESGPVIRKVAKVQPGGPVFHKALNKKSKGNAEQRSVPCIPIVENAAWTDSVNYSNNFNNAQYVDLIPFYIGRYLAVDSENFGSLKWVAAQYDTILDIYSGNGYSVLNTPVTIDSILYQYLYYRAGPSDVVDTLIINIYSGDIKLSPNNDTGAISNTILFADTVLLDTTNVLEDGYVAGTIDYFNYTIQTPGKFSIGFDYRGISADTFGIVAAFNTLCGDSCFASPTTVPGNMQYDEILYGETFNKFNQAATPVTIFDYNCPNGGKTCDLNFAQDFQIYTFMTICPPLTVSASASPISVCPGATYTLTALTSGGAEPYTYLWSGSGNIASPFDSATTVTAVGDVNLVDVLHDTLVVIDADSDTATVVVKVNLEGVGISAGTDTTLLCGDSINLVAAISGYTGAGTVTQWAGSPTPGAVLGFVGPGTYNVSITNGIGCTASSSVTISSVSGQAASFVNSQANSKFPQDSITVSPCANEADTLVNTSSRLNNWTWNWSISPLGDTYTLATDAIVPAGTYTAGSTYIISLVGDSAGCEVFANQTVIAKSATANNGCLSVGINEINLAERVSIAPNPTTGLFNVNFDGIQSSHVNIEVYDILGRNLFVENNFSVNGSETKTIDLSENANGIYFVRLQVDGQPYTLRVSLDK